MMKNRLLITFLTLATIPFFSNATTQQPTNAELLTHLQQNIKVAMESALTELTTATKKMDETHNEIANATRELYSLIAQGISSDIDNLYYNMHSNKTACRNRIFRCFN